MVTVVCQIKLNILRVATLVVPCLSPPPQILPPTIAPQTLRGLEYGGELKLILSFMLCVKSLMTRLFFYDRHEASDDGPVSLL